MKTLATILVLGLLVAAPAMAANLWTETFTYGNGNLTSVSGGLWAVHSGTISGSNDVQVSNGIAVGNNANAPDVNRTFTAQDSTTATTYACFQVKIPSVSGYPGANYFAHFKDGGTFNFMARTYVLPIAGDNAHFNFGLSAYSANNEVYCQRWPNALNYDTWYWVVLAYNSPGRSATMWVNPASPSSQSITSTTTSAGPQVPRVAVSSFALRQSSSTAFTVTGVTGTVNTWTYQVDNLGIGTSFYDACMNTGVVPTPSTTWGQLKRTYR